MKILNDKCLPVQALTVLQAFICTDSPILTTILAVELTGNLFYRQERERHGA